MKNIIFIITLLLSSHCTAQVPDSIKYYSPEQYKDWNPDPEYCGKTNPCSIKESYFYLIKGNERVRAETNNERIRIQKSNFINPFIYVYVYDVNTKQIITNHTYFLSSANSPIGISKYYDKKGKIIKEKNWDELYPFSIDDLVKKFKKEYNVDLLNRKNVNSFLKSEISTPSDRAIYRIRLNTETEGDWIQYLIDGKTGETIYTKKKSEAEEEEECGTKASKPPKKQDASKD